MSSATPVSNKFERIDNIPARWARQTPDAAALIQGGCTLSYAELERHITEAMTVLSGSGVSAGHRVMLVTENCIGAVCFLFAANRLGAAFVIVNARLSTNEIDGIASHCEPQAELYFDTGSGDGENHASRRGAGAQAFPLEEKIFLKIASPYTVPESSGEPVAAIIYTSGTTGKPKGVMLTHANMLFVAETLVAYRHILPADRSYAVLPMSHAMGLTSVLLSTLAAGASVILRDRFDADALIGDLQTLRVTMFQGAQAMYPALLQRLDGRELRLPALRYIYAGGAPLDPVLKTEVERIFGLPLHNGYGMTESSPTICHSLFGQWRQDSSVGPCLPGLQIRIMNDQGTAVAAGEPGELWVRGPNVMKGYFRDPATTSAAIQGGWLRTGDLAKCDKEGNIHLVGRIKEIIIRSGFNVYPAEVEAALNSHPSVEQSVVFGRTVALNEEVVAFVQAPAGASLTAQDLLAYLRDKISPYKRPSEIVFLDALPVMANGKINRSKLKEMAQGKRLETVNDSCCTTENRPKLCPSVV